MTKQIHTAEYRPNDSFTVAGITHPEIQKWAVKNAAGKIIRRYSEEGDAKRCASSLTRTGWVL